MVEDESAAEKTANIAAPSLLHVHVCYAEPERQFLRDLRVPAGTTLRDAVLQSGLLRHLKDGRLENHKLGIYGKLKTPDAVLRDRDRVEIYRPLLADPKDARRRRVEKKKAGRPANSER